MKVTNAKTETVPVQERPQKDRGPLTSGKKLKECSRRMENST